MTERATVVMVVVAVIVAATAFAWLWPSDHADDTAGAEIEGAVTAVDAVTSTVKVSSGFFGLGARTFVVTAETIIAVKGKLGGLGDLVRHQPVRVVYEIFPDTLVATRVDVLDRWSQVPAPLVTVDDGDDAAISGAVLTPAPAPEPARAPAAAVRRPLPRPASEPRPTTTLATTPPVPPPAATEPETRSPAAIVEVPVTPVRISDSLPVAYDALPMVEPSPVTDAPPTQRRVPVDQAP